MSPRRPTPLRMRPAVRAGANAVYPACRFGRLGLGRPASFGAFLRRGQSGSGRVASNLKGRGGPFPPSVVNTTPNTTSATIWGCRAVGSRLGRAVGVQGSTFRPGLISNPDRTAKSKTSARAVWPKSRRMRARPFPAQTRPAISPLECRQGSRRLVRSSAIWSFYRPLMPNLRRTGDRIPATGCAARAGASLPLHMAVEDVVITAR